MAECVGSSTRVWSGAYGLMFPVDKCLMQAHCRHQTSLQNEDGGYCPLKKKESSSGPPDSGNPSAITPILDQHPLVARCPPLPLTASQAMAAGAPLGETVLRLRQLKLAQATSWGTIRMHQLSMWRRRKSSSPPATHLCAAAASSPELWWRPSSAGCTLIKTSILSSSSARQMLRIMLSSPL